MKKQELDLLSEKYLAGTCSPEEASLIESWASLHNKRQTSNPFFSLKSEATENENRLWEKIISEAVTEKDPLLRQARTLWLGVAAASLIVMLTGWLLFERQNPGGLSTTSPAGIQSKNTTVTSQQIQLPDSSIVVLEAGASIVVSENYGKSERTVYLTGEAFFEVRANPQQPFLVYSGDLVTEVLGTSFRIKPEEGMKTIEVSVMTGKVSIYTESNDSQKKRSGVIITPNQKVVFDTESKMMRQDLVDLPEIIVPLPVNSSFIFEDIPVEKVLELMERTYGVEIVMGNLLLKRCVFTGDLSGIGLYEQLDYICDALRVTYDIRGTSIFISGSGCG